jgi:hypothetical protein
MRPLLPRLLALLCALLLCTAQLTVVFAQEGAERVALIIARALSYERTLSTSAGRSVDVLVLYEGKQLDSRKDAEELIEGFRALGSLTIHGVPFVATARPFTASTIEAARGQGYDVVIVCRGLEEHVGVIAQAARGTGLRTVGLSVELARLATSLAVYSEGDKLVVAVHQAHADAEGLKLNSQLLRVAKLL